MILSTVLQSIAMQFIIVKLILNIFSLHNSKNQSLRLVKLHTLPRKTCYLKCS